MANDLNLDNIRASMLMISEKPYQTFSEIGYSFLYYILLLKMANYTNLKFYKILGPICWGVNIAIL